VGEHLTRIPVVIQGGVVRSAEEIDVAALSMPPW
jgi:hypothetical protein